MKENLTGPSLLRAVRSQMFSILRGNLRESVFFFSTKKRARQLSDRRFITRELVTREIVTRGITLRTRNAKGLRVASNSSILLLLFFKIGLLGVWYFKRRCYFKFSDVTVCDFR